MLSFLAIGRTVRRVNTCVAGLAASVYERCMSKPFGPLTRIATFPMPTAVALTPKLTPERCLPFSRIFCSFCGTFSGPSVWQADCVFARRTFDIVEVEADRALVAVSRKRGKVAVSTTGSRTITSPDACPTLSFDQATAITRTFRRTPGYRTKHPRCRPASH